MVSPIRRREAVEHIRRSRPDVSARRACGLVGLSRNAVKAPKAKIEKDRPLVEVLTHLAAGHPRLGYRMLHGMVVLRGFRAGRDRVYRLCRRHGLRVPRRVRKRRAIGVPASAVHVLRATSRNHVWTWDFVHDQTSSDGRTFKILTVVDEYTRVPMLVHVARRINAKGVIRLVTGLFKEYGVPRHIRSDNGPEFIAGRLKKHLRESGVDALYVEPGSPWQNGLIESFNGRLRDECLDREAFMDLREAIVVIGDYRRFYKDARPHSSLGYRTPGSFAALCRGQGGGGVAPPVQGPPLRLAALASAPAPAPAGDLV
jgi:putative transposase